MPVTPTTWEEEAGRLEVREQLGSGALSQKKMFEKDCQDIVQWQSTYIAYLRS